MLPLVAVLLTFVAVACTVGGSSSKPKNTVRMLRINMDSSPPTFDPRIGPDRNTRTVIKALFEGLTRVSPNGETELAAAESVEISDDKRTYTFKLRSATWSNGDPVTSHDFLYAWQTALAPDFPSVKAALFYPIKNAQAIKEGRLPSSALGLDAPDDSTLIVTLEHPTPYFLNLATHALYAPVPSKIAQNDDKWADRAGADFVCNGPFRPTRFTQEKELVLERNATYWKGPTDLPGIEISFVHDSDTVLEMFNRGEIDWVGTPFHDLPIDAIPAARKKAEYHSQPVAGIFWLDCNAKTFPLNSANFRKALAYAIDRKALLNVMQQDEETLSFTIAPAAMTPSQDPKDRIELAQHYLREALSELGISKDELPVLTYMCSDVAGHKTLSQAIQQQWREVLGVQSEIVQLQWNHFISSLRSGDYQLSGLIYDASFDDPAHFFEKLRFTAGNYTSWEHPDYQEALSLAEAATSQEERHQHLSKAEVLFREEMPVIPLFYDEYKWLASPNVDGVYISNLGQSDFTWARLNNS